MKKFIVITGGAGFIGANLIEKLIKDSKYTIISIDNYSTGTKKNHIKNNRVKYIKADTKKISKILHKYKKQINAVFHFGEFARIYQTLKMSELFNLIQLERMLYLVFVLKIKLN